MIMMRIDGGSITALPIKSAGFHHCLDRIAYTALLLQAPGTSFFFPYHDFVSTTDTTHWQAL